MQKAILGLLLCSTLVAAAQATAPARPAPPAEQELAHKILATVESEAASASPDVRAYVLLRFAAGLEGDRQKQRKVFAAAYLATLEIPVGRYNTRGQLQGEILRAMITQSGPAAVEEVMPGADDYSRYMMRELLITRYAEDGNFDRALALLQGAPDQGMYPFAAAEFLMDKLPAQRIAARRTIFTQAVEIAGRNDRTFSLVASMIVKFWRDLPTAQVLLVIDKVLEGARLQDACPTIIKTNMYPYYVDQFLPVLRQLDPAKADRLIREKEQAKANGGLPQERCDYSKMFGARTTPIPDKNTTPPPAPAPVRPQAAPARRRLVFGCDSFGFCREYKIEHVLRQISVHLERNETAAARLAIAHAFAMAAEEWKYDTYADDPNLWTKNMWPSTENWEAFAVLASYVSPQYALDQTRRIPDPGIQLIVREMLAEYWLDRDPDIRPPNIANNEGFGCECVAHYMYIPRHWGEKLPWGRRHH